MNRWWKKRILSKTKATPNIFVGGGFIFVNFHPDPRGTDPISLIFFRWVETTTHIFSFTKLDSGHMHLALFRSLEYHTPHGCKLQSWCSPEWRVLRVEQVIARRMSLRINCLAEIRWDFFQNEGLNLKITEKQTEHGFPKVKPDLFFCPKILRYARFCGQIRKWWTSFLFFLPLIQPFLFLILSQESPASLKP